MHSDVLAHASLLLPDVTQLFDCSSLPRFSLRFGVVDSAVHCPLEGLQCLRQLNP
jgi:hypothetical protein